MAESGLSFTEIVVVVLLSCIALVLLGLLIYKVLAARKQRNRMRLMEQGSELINAAHAGRQQAMQVKTQTANELEDLQTKVSKSDKNSEEQQQNDEPPSLNAEELIQNVFAPETDDRISRRRKVNKLMKKNTSQTSS